MVLVLEFMKKSLEFFFFFAPGTINQENSGLFYKDQILIL